MYLFSYIIFFLIPLFSQIEESDIITIRDLYYKASISKEDAEKFKSTLAAIPNPNESIKGYIAASHMIDAKYVYNPATKLSYFNKGKAQLESTIKNDPQNIELRFLRISIQTNAPSFLGYNGQIAPDKALIISKYPALTDLDLKKRIKGFMTQSSICTEQEKKIFN